MQLEVLNIKGEATGRKVDLPDDIFGIEPNDHAVWLAVRQFQANNRQGTHKTKERWEISRTTKKAFRQKGTGGARRGSMKSPGLKGGGRAFGPQPHGYDIKVNKKVKEVAKKSALSYKAKNGNLIIVEDFNVATPKTKEFAAVINGLNLKGTKSVFVINGADKNTVLSAQNIPTVNLTEARNLNIYDIMNCKKLVLSEGAVKSIESNFSNN